MSTITASTSIHLKMDGSTNIQYNLDGVGFITITAWPVTITNGNAIPGPSAILNVICDVDLTISSSTGGTTGYFIVGSSYITFDGSSNNININAIIGYPGLIRNGRDNVIVKNFITNVSLASGSTLENSGGWLCQSYYARDISDNFIQNCTNNGPVNGVDAGGIAGRAVAFFRGWVTFTNCINNGEISTDSAGGIVGIAAGQVSQTLLLINCTNNGLISGSRAGGIAGRGAGFQNGLGTFINCTNTGVISGLDAGGIIGPVSGSVYIENSRNTGNISGVNSGGIVGASAGGANNEIVTIRKCFSTGNITGQYAGGIVGANFSYNNTQRCEISNSYSTGSISGNNAGGIIGADVGFTTGSVTPVIDISNCYSLGAIATTCGGICGGWNSVAYTATPIVTITNCYSWGSVTDASSGIVATSLPIPTNQNNIYVANSIWADTTANASLTSGTTPTNINTNNPGSTWTKIANNTTTPYVLSSFNAQIYNPNSASSSSSNYTTSAGLFTDSSYNLLYNNQVSNVATILVFVSKGTPSPYYYSYNTNTFVFTNSNPATSTESIDVNITPSNGVLSISVACFKKGTKILCENEIYIPIEELKIGDLVKTYKHGYQKIIMHAHSSLCDYFHNKINKLYTYSREKNPDLIEDLHLTGGHSLLVDALTEEESTHMQKIQWSKDTYMVEDKYKLLACFSSNLYIAAEQNVEIYHFTLEPPENAIPDHVYAVYANGILAESCSKIAMEKTCNNI
jgi:hypothetical protein